MFRRGITESQPSSLTVRISAPTCTSLLIRILISESLPLAFACRIKITDDYSTLISQASRVGVVCSLVSTYRGGGLDTSRRPRPKHLRALQALGVRGAHNMVQWWKSHDWNFLGEFFKVNFCNFGGKFSRCSNILFYF